MRPQRPHVLASCCALSVACQRRRWAVLAGGGRKDDQVLTAAGGVHTGHGGAELIEKCWPGVIRVAQALHRDGEVFQKDVLAALGITDHGGPTSAQLASLRAGFRPVPPLAKTRRPVPT
jgi:hypothetical protein